MTGRAWIEMGGQAYATEQFALFPCAGGGTATVAELATHLSRFFAVVALRLPGRESRFAEEPVADLERVVEVAAEALEPLLSKPTHLIGHSLGALLAYRVLHRLGQPEAIRTLTVIGRRAPHLPPPAHRIGDPADSDMLRASYAARPALPLAGDPDLTDYALRVLRADLSLDGQHTAAECLPPIRPPLVAVAGAGDD
jgi:pyochelin biosynthesis protein PchC